MPIVPGERQRKRPPKWLLWTTVALLLTPFLCLALMPAVNGEFRLGALYVDGLVFPYGTLTAPPPGLGTDHYARVRIHTLRVGNWVWRAKIKVP